jgi:hypothetical protein
LPLFILHEILCPYSETKAPSDSKKKVLIQVIQTPPLEKDGPGLGALGNLQRHISESPRSLELMQKSKVMEMGSSRFFID